jgi:hypothetical protein
VPADREVLKTQVLDGLRRATMLPADAVVESVWAERLEYGYPVPYVERNMHMHKVTRAHSRAHARLPATVVKERTHRHRRALTRPLPP